MNTFHEIENALRDYHWMTKEIVRLREELETDIKHPGTAKYGIEATLPKPNEISDPVANSAIKRDRRQRTLKKFEKKVHFIDVHSCSVEDDKDLAVLNCMLDGMSIVGISQHMGFSERKVYKIKDEIVKKLKENAGNAENASYAG